MTKIYDQHEAAFKDVQAFVVLGQTDEMGKPNRVATIAFKFPRDGAGRLFAYVHFFGIEMVRGFASGGGYDKKTAACSAAVSRMKDGLAVNHWQAHEIAEYDKFRAALALDGGNSWDSALRDAGFTVMQAV